jgi:RHS repeat-associated protein
MLMPERSGYKTAGGWASGNEQINGNTLPQTLSVDERHMNTPSEYKASQWIEITDGFSSGTSDEFVAYIADGSNTTAGNPGGSGGENNSYRYGFNGKENDDEVKGVADEVDYGFRIYDSRLSKFLSVDPLTKKYPELTPYQFASNSPIANIDRDGKEAKYYNIVITESFDGKGKLIQSTKTTTYDKAKEAGWHMHGIIPWYTGSGKLGDGTLYSVTKVKVYTPDKNGVQREEISNVGSVYTPPPPEVNKEHPASSFSFGIKVFGNGADPEEAATSKATSDMHIISFNFKEFQEIMEPILLGMDAKSPSELEVPTIDDLIEHAGELGLDKAIEKLNQKWEAKEKEGQEKKKNAPTFCSTCNHTFEKKNDTLTYNQTEKPAEDTVDAHEPTKKKD